MSAPALAANAISSRDPQQFSPPASGHYGVFPLSREEADRLNERGKKWKAKICHVPSGLGYHKTMERAALAYDKEARACMELSSEMRKPLNYDSLDAGKRAARAADLRRPANVRADCGRPPRPPLHFYGLEASGSKW